MVRTWSRSGDATIDISARRDGDDLVLAIRDRGPGMPEGAEAGVALARRLRDHEDLGAARQLVLSHLRFVVHIARGYSGYGLPVGDLIQERQGICRYRGTDQGQTPHRPITIVWGPLSAGGGSDNRKICFPL